MFQNKWPWITACIFIVMFFSGVIADIIVSGGTGCP